MLQRHCYIKRLSRAAHPTHSTNLSACLQIVRQTIVPVCCACMLAMRGCLAGQHRRGSSSCCIEDETEYIEPLREVFSCFFGKARCRVSCPVYFFNH